MGDSLRWALDPNPRLEESTLDTDAALKFAAIDIGSNAVRLLLAGVMEDGPRATFHKMSLIRMPVRLGYEAFTRGRLSQAKEAQLLKTMTGFRHLLEAFQPIGTMACATAALRCLENRQDICDRIRRNAGISIDVIDGAREAQILLENSQTALAAGTDTALFVDVGGGSTELTLLVQDRITGSASFPIGTLRLLHDLVSPRDWQDLQQWLTTHAAPSTPAVAIGSGGNINKIFRLANGKKETPLSVRRIRSIQRMLAGLSVDQRIARLGLRPDRADVIVPAAAIYLQVMKWAGIQKMAVPMVGLVDGMIRQLYKAHRARQHRRPASGRRP